MDDAVGGYDAVALHEGAIACIIGDAATSLHHDEAASHKVPLADIALGVGIEFSCCHVTEGHRGAADGTDAAHITIEMADEPADDRLVGLAVIGQLQADEGIADGACPHMEALAVHPGAASKPGVVAFVGTDLIDDTYQYLLPLTEGDGYGVWCETVNEIGGAVEGIDDPKERFVLVSCQSLLCDEASLRQQFAQSGDNLLLRALINV